MTLGVCAPWQVLNKFGEVNLAEINSKGGFFMGIIKRFREQERGVFAGGPDSKVSAPCNIPFSLVIHNRSGITVHAHLIARCFLAGLNPTQFPAASSAGSNVFQVAPGGGFWPMVQAKLEAIYAQGHVGFPCARMSRAHACARVRRRQQCCGRFERQGWRLERQKQRVCAELRAQLWHKRMLGSACKP